MQSKDVLAARSKLAKRIFGEEATARGLNKIEKRLLSDIEKGSGDYQRFKKLYEEIKNKDPKLSDAEIRFQILKEDYELFHNVTRLEKNIDQIANIRARLEGDFHLEEEAMAGMKNRPFVFNIPITAAEREMKIRKGNMMTVSLRVNSTLPATWANSLSTSK